MNLPHNMCISESKELYGKSSEFEPEGYGLRKSEGTLHCGFASRRDKLPKELATLEIASCSQRQSNEWTSAIRKISSLQEILLMNSLIYTMATLAGKPLGCLESFRISVQQVLN